jgi:hypothetical protein
MSFGATDRDTGLRRVSRLTRWLVAGSVAVAGVLSAVVAQALPGNATGTTPPSSGPADAGAAPAAGATPPTAPPATSPSVNNDPALQPAPPPVPTHHHSVAHSGGS